MEKIINVSTPGSLSSLLSSNEKLNITKLTITGNVDARDFLCIRDELMILNYLDLSEIIISKYTGTGGTYYYYANMEYLDNEIPAHSFLKIDLKPGYYPEEHYYPGGVDNRRDPSVLTTLILPNTITSIGITAFYQNTGLKSIIIPDSVIEIKSNAFQECTGLEFVCIGNGVNHIYSQAFLDYPNLQTLIIKSTIPPIADFTTFRPAYRGNIPNLYVPDESIELYNAANGFEWYKSTKIFGISTYQGIVPNTSVGIMTTTTTTNTTVKQEDLTINGLLELLNNSENLLNYNTSIENEIKNYGGSVLYKFNNIIIASEISETVYKELLKNPDIDYIESLPLKKYIGNDYIDSSNLSQTILGVSGAGAGAAGAGGVGVTGVTGGAGVVTEISSLDAINAVDAINNKNAIGSVNSTGGVNGVSDVSGAGGTSGTGGTDLTGEAVETGGVTEIDGVTVIGDLAAFGITLDGIPGLTENKPLVSLTASGTTLNQKGIPPVITNTNTTISAGTNTNFTYNISTTGTLPIKFEVIKPANFEGTLNIKNTQLIGNSKKLGVYNITLKAINAYGSYTKDIKITISDPVKITNTNLILKNKLGSNFSYSIESSGSLPKTYSMNITPSGVTTGLILDGNIISGITLNSGDFNINIGVSGLTSSDSKILKLSVGSQPIITSSGIASGSTNAYFEYTITSLIPSGISYSISGALNNGLSFKGNSIEGIPTSIGSKTVTIKATNAFGESTKNLTITIYEMGT